MEPTLVQAARLLDILAKKGLSAEQLDTWMDQVAPANALPDPPSTGRQAEEERIARIFTREKIRQFTSDKATKDLEGRVHSFGRKMISVHKITLSDLVHQFKTGKIESNKYTTVGKKTLRVVRLLLESEGLLEKT